MKKFVTKGRVLLSTLPFSQRRRCTRQLTFTFVVNFVKIVALCAFVAFCGIPAQ